MPLVTSDALVLQAFPYSETSKILRLLTPGHGVQSVIARGARRPKSRYGGVLEPFTEGTASFHLRPNRDLHTLAGFDLVRSRQDLGRDLIRFGAASLLGEIVLRTGSEQAAPEVYLRLRQGLDELEEAEGDLIEPVALAQAWALITSLGFGPSLDRCVGCGASLPEARPLFFDYGAGGVHCGECGGGGGGGRVLPPRARAELAAFARGEPRPVEGTAAHWQLLARFLAYHLVDAGSLRSLAFLSDAVGAS